MTRTSNCRPLATLALVTLALTGLALAATPATAEDHEAVEHEKVFVKKIVHDCEGDDCDDIERRVIVVDGDGKHPSHGKVMKWIGRDGMHAMAFGDHGKGGFLGVQTTELTRELRRHFGVPEEAGVLVAKVVDDSAAAAAGLLVGDILTAVDGAKVDSTGDLVRAIGKQEPGTAVSLELWRDGTLRTLGATLGERPRQRRHAMVMHCGEDDEDCPQIAALEGFDCGDEANCEVRVECGDAGCDCTVNGETAECETLPGFVAPGE